MRVRWLLLLAVALTAILFRASAFAESEECKRLRLEKERVAQQLREADESGDTKALDRLSEKLRDLIDRLRTCELQDRSLPTYVCYGPWVDLRRTGFYTDSSETKWVDKINPSMEKALRDYCACLRDNKLPIARECLEFGGQIFPGDTSLCDQAKKDYEDKHRALEKVAGAKASEVQKLQKAEQEAQDSFCKCLVKLGVRLGELPDFCRDPKYLTGEMPPPPPPPSAETKKNRDTSPPPKALSPPPTRSLAPPPPSSSTYCGKKVCDCKPPNVCPAASKCACTKG